MADPIDQEIEAIRALLTALEPLSAKARRSALAYVTRRLEIEIDLSDSETSAASADSAKSGSTAADNDATGKSDATHIKTLKDSKRPRSVSEMAAVVAYYLSHVAPKAERKEAITTEDIETWFKIADFKLPEQPRYTLPNAKKAGYLKQVGAGQYALNPVGYNLVVHSLPRDGKTSESPRRRSKPRSTKRGSRKSRAK